MPTTFPNKDRKHLLLTLLKVMGGHKVVVTFGGGGDSGSIENVELFSHDNNPINIEEAEFEWEEESHAFDVVQKEWVTTKQDKIMPLKDILQKITENALEESGLDWYNNEGGQGSLEIDLSEDPPAIILNVGINYTHTEDHMFDLTENEEGEEEPTQYADLTAEDKAREELLGQLKGAN